MKPLIAALTAAFLAIPPVHSAKEVFAHMIVR
jgi:hypothetical protein